MNEIMPDPLNSTPDEIWKAIPGWEFYSVSNLGNVRREISPWRTTARILNKHITRIGYCFVGLSNKKFKQNRYIHRLVAEAFIEPVPGKNQINHKDGDKTNNRVSNLERVTQSENLLHRYRVLGIKAAHGETHCCATLSTKDVLEIRRLHAEGYKNAEITRMFKLSQSHVGQIVRGEMWKHLIPPASETSPSSDEQKSSE